MTLSGWDWSAAGAQVAAVISSPDLGVFAVTAAMVGNLVVAVVVDAAPEEALIALITKRGNSARTGWTP
jgi:ribosomal protein L14